MSDQMRVLLEVVFFSGDDVFSNIALEPWWCHRCIFPNQKLLVFESLSMQRIVSACSLCCQTCVGFAPGPLRGCYKQAVGFSCTQMPASKRLWGFVEAVWRMFVATRPAATRPQPGIRQFLSGRVHTQSGSRVGHEKLLGGKGLTMIFQLFRGSDSVENQAWQPRIKHLARKDFRASRSSRARQGLKQEF